MPKRTPEELAARLARKAEEEDAAVRVFAGSTEIADTIVGFHAQQAVEKWLKAVMAKHGMRQTRIHDIGQLVELLEAEGIDPPADRDRLDELTVYAVPLRYENLLDAEPLDRGATLDLVDRVGHWADQTVT